MGFEALAFAGGHRPGNGWRREHHDGSAGEPEDQQAVWRHPRTMACPPRPVNGAGTSGGPRTANARDEGPAARLRRRRLRR